MSRSDQPEAPPADEVGAGLAATAADMGKRHIRGSSLLLVGRVLSLAFTVATQVIIARAYSKTDFGVFALALVITSASRLVLSLGQGKTLSRFLAIYVEERDWGRLYGSVLIASGTVLVTGTALVVGLALSRDALVGSIVEDNAAVTVLLIVVLMAPMEALDQVFVSIFAVLTRPRSIFFRKYIFTPGLRLLVVVSVVLFDGDVIVLAIGYVSAQLLGLVLYTVLLRTVLKDQGLLPELRWRKLSWPMRSVFTFAVPLLSTEVVYLSMNTGSVLLLSSYFDTAEVADLRVVIPAVTLNKIVYSTFLTLYLPMATRLFAREDFDRLRADYWRTAAFVAVASFPVFAMTGPFAEPTTVLLFGDKYAGSALILAVLSVGYYLNSATGFNMVTLQAYGKVRFLVWVNLGSAAGNLALSLVLIPRYGAMGVAVANCVTLLVQNAANQVGLRVATGTPLLARAYLRTYASIAVAAGLLVAADQLWSPGVLVAVVLTGLATLGLLAVNRPVLALVDDFPELAKVPLLRWFVSGRPRS